MPITSFSKKIVAIILFNLMILAAALFFISPSQAQEELSFVEVKDSENPTKTWVAYGPNSAANYSFWYASSADQIGQNGVMANWTLPENYSLGETRFPMVIETGDRQAPTFMFGAGSRILQEIIVPKGTTADLSTLSLTLTYGDCADVCTSQTATASLSGKVPVAMEQATIPKRTRGIWMRGDNETLGIGLHNNYNKDGRVDRAFFLPFDANLITTAAPLRLDNFKEVGFFSNYPLGQAMAADALIKGILVLDKPLVNGLEAHSIALTNDYAEATMAPDGMSMGGAATTATNEGGSSSTSLMMAIALAFIGGLILNAMPCVFPVLALKVFSVIKSGDEDQSAIKKDALAYTAGVVLSFVLLAGVLISIRAAGIGAGWGYQLQSPMFVLGMALVFFTMGLNFLGVFEISGFLTGAGQSLTTKKGTKGAFFTGALATLVAAPCTAPFMVTAVAYALAQPPLVALSIFASLGLGLASPYLLIGFVPASRGFIPKPGQWMVTFRNFLAFPMFATVVWMVWILSIQTGSTGVFLALAPMVMIGFGLWAAKVSKGLTKGLAVTVSLVVVVYGLTTIKPNMSLMPNNGRQIETSLNVIPFSYAKLANLRMEGKNVFIHHWAAWCMICLIHENLVFETEDFQKFLRDTNTVFMQADRTNNDPELLKFMEETYGRSSQPIDVFYTANMMDKPIVFPTLFTTAKVIHLMRERMREMAVINANN